jgi:hypothetical protein
MLFLPPAMGESGTPNYALHNSGTPEWPERSEGAIFTECNHTPFGVNSISNYNYYNPL